MTTYEKEHDKLRESILNLKEQCFNRGKDREELLKIYESQPMRVKEDMDKGLRLESSIYYWFSQKLAKLLEEHS